ncbi:MFS transporter [Amycolatopsis sp. 195334CR]|uniref:MFS transporter n=1 Tax=Amycolatopsis sp. 195334CR TaxID=2814588 RepID=UPI001A90287C|nr:MFS transporter [Amycolatopsis sp. 195334CR]MBN6038117.1 MFS transporter [Amycolatopsis sp. 195334CR]
MRTTLAAALAAAFAASTTQTIVIAALPAFAGQFGVPGTVVPWALTAFMLASAVATPIAGRLGDLFGYRRIALACLGSFTAGLLLCALADSFPLLLAGRVLTGVAGGLFPLAFGLVRRAVPADRLPGAVALLSAIFGIGGAAGMLAAGPLLTFGTSWLFWPLLALALVAFALVLSLPADVSAGGGQVDSAGAALLGGALTALLLGISQAKSWGTGPSLGLFALAVVLFAGFAAVEARTRQPLVDLRLLGSRGMAVTNLTTVVVAAAMFGVVTLIPPLVPQHRIAVALLPMVVLMLAAVPVAARLGGRRAVRAGAALGIVSSAALVFAHDELWQICVAGLFLGAGHGLAFAAFGPLVVDAVDAGRTGMATGVNTIARTAGGAVGAQVAAVLVAEGSYATAFVTFAVVGAGALALTFALPSAKLTAGAR